MTARLTFLSGPHQGKRCVVDDATIALSGDVSQTVHAPDASAHGALAVIVEAENGYRIAAPPPPAPLTVKGVEAGDGCARMLRDGDLIQCGARRLRGSPLPHSRRDGAPAPDTAAPARRPMRVLWTSPAVGFIRSF
jgi:hypothetical protein